MIAVQQFKYDREDNKHNRNPVTYRSMSFPDMLNMQCVQYPYLVIFIYLEQKNVNSV